MLTDLYDQIAGGQTPVPIIGYRFFLYLVVLANTAGLVNAT